MCMILYLPREREAQREPSLPYNTVSESLRIAPSMQGLQSALKPLIKPQKTLVTR